MNARDIDLSSVHTICFDCAQLLGFERKDKAVGVWTDNCEVCHQRKACTNLWHDWEPIKSRRQMKKHNVLVTVNGISKSRAQWAKELGVTKGAISLRESKGESASSAISEIIGTVHTRKILEHYVHAREKHPYFCDGILSFVEDYKGALLNQRLRLADAKRCRMVTACDLIDCELLEAYVEAADGKNARAVEECYDAIAVLLRTIDVLEGRQKLGNPETKGEDK